MTYQLYNPNGVEFVSFDWSDRLNAGVTISTSSWSAIPADLSFSSQTITDQTTQAKVTYAPAASPSVTVYGDYDIYNLITTSDGQTIKEKALTIRIHGE